MPLSLSGLALEYRIYRGATKGSPDKAIEVAFGQLPVKDGVSFAYFNFLDQFKDDDGNLIGVGAPYLPATGTAKKYDEGVPNPKGAGFERNLIKQFSKARADGHEAGEIDNPDDEHFSTDDVIHGVELAATFGLGAIAKNPALLWDGGTVRYVAHPNIFGVIVEAGAGTADELHDIRQRAAKPDLPVWFVYKRGERDLALRRKAEILAGKYINMGVTYDASDDEYGGEIEHVLLPLTKEPDMPQNVWWGDSGRRVAKSLRALYDQANAAFPNRDRSTDGTIGDDAHQATNSDHNPQITYNGDKIVTAIDITHNVARGIDMRQFSEALRLSRDPRIKYVIFNGRIFSSTSSPWVWRARNSGPGDHTGHCHISVSADPAKFDDTRPWQFDLGAIQPPPVGVDGRPMLAKGAEGDDVRDLQRLLGGIEVDGVFGEDTDAAVRLFQSIHSLEVDGVVGPLTWAELLKKPPPAPGGSVPVLSPEIIAKISQAAAASSLAKYSWKDRGVAPIGYIKGMAVVYARCLKRLAAGDSAALAMTRPIGDRDALAIYGVTETDRKALLRKLFVLLYGLGMMESSGRYGEGRDGSADNTSGDEAEAGLFQQSWNSRVASSELPKLFDAYVRSPSPPDGYLSIFREGVSAAPEPNSGSGEGVTFQALCKSHPAFAVEAAAIGVRVLADHWGPLLPDRKTAQMRPEAEALLRQVETLVDIKPEPEPEPEPIPVPKSVEEAIANYEAASAAQQAAFAALKEAIKMAPQPTPAPLTAEDVLKIVQEYLNRQQPAAPVTLVGVTPPAGTVPAPSQRPSVQASVAALIAVLIGQWAGVVPGGFGIGDNPSELGTAAVATPALSAVAGYFGGWERMLQILQALGRAIQPKPVTK